MTCRPTVRNLQEHVLKIGALREVHPLTFWYSARVCAGCPEFVTSAAPHAVTTRVSDRLILSGQIGMLWAVGCQYSLGDFCVL